MSSQSLLVKSNYPENRQCNNRQARLRPILPDDARPCDARPCGTRNISACRDILCAKPFVLPETKCDSDIVETNEITYCDVPLFSTDIDAPRDTYVHIDECDINACPSAALVSAINEGITFNALGLDFFLRAGPIDTECKAEIAQVNVPATAFATVPLINYASDISFFVLGGTPIVSVNTVERQLAVGSHVYIKAGSSYSIINRSGVACALTMTAVGAGTLGYYNAVAAYQTAVGSIANVDYTIVEQLGMRYKIFPAPGSSAFFNGSPIVQIPGSVRFLPTPLEDCKNGSWGLNCKQMLVINTLAAQATAPVVGVNATLPTRTSSTIRAEDNNSFLLVDPTLTSVAVTATILRNPSAGLPQVLRTPTINGLTSAVIPTGGAYYAFYDAFKNNVAIVPTAYNTNNIFAQ